MHYSVKNVKFHKGMEGQGVNCTLYRLKSKIATYHDSGNGGIGIFTWIDINESKLFKDFVNRQRPFKPYNDDPLELKHDGDTVVNALISDYERKRISKKYIYFRVVSQKYLRDEWEVVNIPFTEPNKMMMVNRYNISEFFGDKMHGLVS